MKRIPNEQPYTKSDLRIALVGEAPGETEEYTGRPFVGASGQLLDKMLAKAGIDRTACYVGNVYQYRPPLNKIDKIDRHSTEWLDSVARLTAELVEFKPHCVIALGKTALQFLMQKDSIENWRGSLLTAVLLDGTFGTMLKVLPTYHPAAVLRMNEYLPVVQADLKRAKLYAEGKVSIPKRTFITKMTFTEAGEWLERARKNRLVTVDIETDPGGQRILCVGFGLSKSLAFSIACDQRWTVQEEALLWIHMKDVLADPQVAKSFQFGQFDMTVLGAQRSVIVNNVPYDTLIMHHNCYPEFPNGLGFQCSLYTLQPYYKDVRSDQKKLHDKGWVMPEASQTLLEYNCMDCCVQFEITEILQLELDELQAWGGANIDMASLPIAIEMTFRGIKVDQERMKLRYEETDKEITNANNQLTQIFGEPVNTKSPKQLKELLYTNLGLPVQYGETGGVTVGADALIKLTSGYPNVRGLKEILRNRQLRTKQAFFNIETRLGRIHPGYNVCGTETGRWSSSESPLGGRNIMNIPEDCRDIFVADEGKILLAWDKSAAEARVVAERAWLETGDKTYKMLVDSGVKVHIWFGLRLIERGVFKITKEQFLAASATGQTDPNYMYYILAKKSVHGYSYGMGPRIFQELVAKETDGEVSISFSMSNAIRDTFCSELSPIPKWWEVVKSVLTKGMRMTNAFGRSRIFFGRWDESLWKKAYAFEPQSTVADDTALSMQRVWKAIPEAEILQQNYDSILVQVPTADVEAIAKRIAPLVQQPIILNGFFKSQSIAFTIPVVFKVGHNWQDMEKLKV